MLLIRARGQPITGDPDNRLNEGAISARYAKAIRGARCRKAEDRVEITHESKVAYFRLKITLALSTCWKGQKSQNATIQEFCSGLESLRERFRGCGRGIGVRWVDVGKGGIERAVPEVLTNQEGICALVNHEHGSGVLQDMRVL